MKPVTLHQQSTLNPQLQRESSHGFWLGAGQKIPSGAVFAEKVRWRGATKENTPCGSSTEEQRSQMACCAKTPPGGGSFDFVRRCLGWHSPLRGCATLAALAKIKIPRRSTLCNFLTGSYERTTPNPPANASNASRNGWRTVGF